MQLDTTQYSSTDDSLGTEDGLNPGVDEKNSVSPKARLKNWMIT